MNTLKPHLLTIKAGAKLYNEDAPPGEHSSNVVHDVFIEVWVRPEDEWVVNHMLRFWNEVAVA